MHLGIRVRNERNHFLPQDIAEIARFLHFHAASLSFSLVSFYLSAFDFILTRSFSDPILNWVARFRRSRRILFVIFNAYF